MTALHIGGELARLEEVTNSNDLHKMPVVTTPDPSCHHALFLQAAAICLVLRTAGFFLVLECLTSLRAGSTVQADAMPRIYLGREC